MCRWVPLLVVLLLVGACSGDSEDVSAPPASTSTTTTSVALTTTTTTPVTTTSTTAAPTTTTTSSTTTTTSSTTTTAPPTTTTVAAVPPMQCSWSDADPEGCTYWGYIASLDPNDRTVSFDLVLFKSGEFEADFEIINNNPLIRTLPLAEDVTVEACPTAPGSTVPAECGDPTFDEFPLTELATWVANGYDFWGLVLDNDQVALIQQWWWP